MDDDAAPGSAQKALWVYAIRHGGDHAALPDLTGVGGGQLRTLQAGSLAAVVESVDPGAFSEEGLQHKLSEPAELEALARRHHDVVAAVTALGPTLPFRLATVYLTDDRVQGMLRQREDEFCRTLGWLAGRAECGVKARADPDSLLRERGTAQPETRGPGGEPAGAELPDPPDQPGAAYLFRRRAELTARAQGQRLAARCGEEIHAALDRMAVASHLHPLHDTQAPGDTTLEVLNAAYLVDSTRLSVFADFARVVATETGALMVDVTGPWPAYSFADGWTA